MTDTFMSITNFPLLLYKCQESFYVCLSIFFNKFRVNTSKMLLAKSTLQNLTCARTCRILLTLTKAPFFIIWLQDTSKDLST